MFISGRPPTPIPYRGNDDALGQTDEFIHAVRSQAPGGIGAIGRTPLVRLSRLVDDDCAEVWVKLEGANPTGSYKDRAALAMIEAAEADGRLKSGQAVVEYTGGSTGSSLALVCAMKGYPLYIVSSDAFAAEKIRTMRAFGATVELVPSPEGTTPELMPSMMRRAREITAEQGAFATDQFNNHDMIRGYQTLVDEVLAQLPQPPTIDASCCFIGTAGFFLGTTRALTHKSSGLHRVVVEPAESAVLSGRAPGAHRIEGGGFGYRPPLLSAHDYDEVIAIPEADAFEVARQATRLDGIFSGPSTGANLAAALRLARRLGPGRRVLTVQVDSGLKYIGSQLYA
jgi:cysteine synthase